MKKRNLTLGSIALLTVTLFGTGLVLASAPAVSHGAPAQSHGAGACAVPSPTPTPTPSPTPTATPTPTPIATPANVKVAVFGGRVTPGHPCGWIVVQAKVLHAVRGKTFSATATANFTGGPVTITLRRAGKSFVAIGKIRVPGGQAAGPVVVDITIVYGGATEPVIHKTSQITAP